MDFLLPFLSVFGTGLQIAGQLDAGSAAAEVGRAQRQSAIYEAQQLRGQAGQVIAMSQRGAQEERRQSRLAASRALAVAAASGAGASDPTVVNIISDIAGEGAYRASVALYEGEERARQLRMAADAEEYSGEVAAIGGRQREQAYQLGALGSGISGAGSLYEKYGMVSRETSSAGYTPTMDRRGSFAH